MSVSIDRSRSLSRRSAAKLVLGAAGLAIGGGILIPVSAAQTYQPNSKKPKHGPGATSSPSTPAPQPNAAGPAPDMTTIIIPGRERRYTLKIQVFIDSYQTPVTHYTPNTIPVITNLSFQSAAIVFPVIRGTASSETLIDQVKGEMSFENQVEDATPTYNEGYHSGTRLGRWELHNKTGRHASLKLAIPMRTWETKFDEAAAMRVPWPNDPWPEVPASTFEHQLFIDREQPPMTDVVAHWLDGADPKSMPPVRVAKILMGKVLEAIQPTGVGYVSARNGMFMGMDLKGAAATLADGQGSEHDIACVLAGAYRNAGLPARMVIGNDLTETKGQGTTVIDRVTKSGGTHLRSWVEFCLYDDVSKKEVWVPVDPVRLRKSSNRAPPIEQTWKYFGSHKELEDVLPFAFQYHPPTTVVAHGAVAFWGWLTLPATQPAEQWLQFNSETTPKHGADDQER